MNLTNKQFSHMTDWDIYYHQLREFLERKGKWMDDNRMLDVTELAAVLKVPKSWVYEQTAKGPGSIPHVRLGKYIRFDPKEVIEFFKSKERSPEK